jgi:hypothetical protein
LAGATIADAGAGNNRRSHQITSDTSSAAVQRWEFEAQDAARMM